MLALSEGNVTNHLEMKGYQGRYLTKSTPLPRLQGVGQWGREETATCKVEE
jgi:hypothetical protein